ncbi:MAG: MFS transporter [Acidimicrobiales bacterium]
MRPRTPSRTYDCISQRNRRWYPGTPRQPPDSPTVVDRRQRDRCDRAWRAVDLRVVPQRPQRRPRHQHLDLRPGDRHQESDLGHRPTDRRCDRRPLRIRPGPRHRRRRLLRRRGDDGLAATATQLYLSGGFVVGVGLAATSFAVVLASIGRRFPPERRSTALGIATAVGSGGQFVFVQLANRIDAAAGWQTALTVLGLVTLAIVVLARPLRGNAEDADAPTNQAESPDARPLNPSR